MTGQPTARDGDAPRVLPALKRALVLNVGALALVLGAGEIVARLVPPRPSLASHILYVPGRTFRYAAPPRGPEHEVEYDNEIVFNRYGFHGPDHPPRRAPGKRRAVLIGDSMVEALQVPLEETLAVRLESHLPGWETLGFGKSGHSTVKQGEVLRSLPGLLSDDRGPDIPDVAVFFVHGPYAVRQALVDFVRPRALWRRGMAWTLLHYQGPSRLLMLARDSVLLRLAVPTDDLLAEARKATRPGYSSGLLEEAWERIGSAVRSLGEEARSMGARPVFVYVPDPSELGTPGPGEDFGVVPGKFRKFAQEAEADWVDLSGAVRETPDPAGLFFKYDQHLNPRGHDLVARLLAERLKEILGPR